MEKAEYQKLLENENATLENAYQLIKKANFTTEQFEALYTLIVAIQLNVDFLEDKSQYDADAVKDELRHLLKNHRHFEDNKVGFEMK